MPVETFPVYNLDVSISLKMANIDRMLVARCSSRFGLGIFRFRYLLGVYGLRLGMAWWLRQSRMICRHYWGIG